MQTILIKSPKYSFIQFKENWNEEQAMCCNLDEQDVLPILKPDDLAFQFVVELENTTAGWAVVNKIMSEPVSNVELFIEYGEAGESSIIHNLTTEDGGLFTRYRIAGNKILYTWNTPFTGMNEYLECGKCYRLGIKLVTEDETVVLNEITAVSNKIIRSCDNGCYTSVLQYSNEEDYADFYYCDDTSVINRVRLPFYLTKPKTSEDKATYRLSNGAIKQTRSLLTKEYTVVTDLMTEDFHDKIVVALAHDFVKIETEKNEGFFSKKEDYDIEWVEGNCKAPATFKVIESEFILKNNNCADCRVPFSCVPVSFNEPVFANATIGQLYNVIITLNGTLPFSFVNEGIPNWMTATIEGNILTLSGTPTVEASGVEIAFSVENCGGDDNYQHFDTTIDVVECEEVTFLEEPSLPAGYKNVYYSYTIPLGGTSPFVLSNVVKPDWMTISFVGNNVMITGTPTKGDISYIVSFEVSNCADEGSVPYSGSFDVFNSVQPGDVISECNLLMYEPITYGLAGTYTFSGMVISTSQAGPIVVTVHNNQAGSLNGYSMYKQQTINIAPGQTSLDFDIDYDGGGINSDFYLTIIITDAGGSQLCENSGQLYSFT